MTVGSRVDSVKPEAARIEPPGRSGDQRYGRLEILRYVERIRLFSIFTLLGRVFKMHLPICWPNPGTPILYRCECMHGDWRRRDESKPPDDPGPGLKPRLRAPG